MAEQKKDPPGAQDSEAKPKSIPASLDPDSTVKTWWDPATGQWMSCTAMRDVLYPENASYNTDIEGIERSLNEDIRNVKSAETIEQLLLLGHTIRRYVRYRKVRERENKRFFEEIEPHVIGLCTGHPEIPYPPSPSEPLKWVKWLGDIKAATGRGRGPSEPTKIANEAYLLYTSMGISQKDVAGTLSQRYNRPVSQGQVSRWVTKVRAFHQATGLLVDTPQQKRKVTPVDPSVLDRGRRTDGKTPGR